jgi:hypothetical protein
VTAHVVVGKNVFSDIGGSFSDILRGQFSGRRSKSSLRQLASINDAALKDLRQQAAEKGGRPFWSCLSTLCQHLRRQPAAACGDGDRGGPAGGAKRGCSTLGSREGRGRAGVCPPGRGGLADPAPPRCRGRGQRAAQRGAMGISHSEPGDRTGPVYPRLFIRDSVNNMLNQPVLSKKKTRVVCWAQDDVGALPEPSAKHISTTCLYNNLLGAG